MSLPAGTAMRSVPLGPGLAIAAVVVLCMVYANLSFAVTRPSDYRYFPPFHPCVNRNMNWALGHESFNIARALAEGEGFAHPFPGRTGPTAWMPPVLPALLAALWWACGGNRPAVVAVVLVVQGLVLILTGLLTLAIARQSTRRLEPVVVAGIYSAALLCNFRDCFQANGDRWLTLLTVDLLLAGLTWGRPLQSGARAAGWGLFGGFCALSSPVAGFVWGVLSVALGLRQRAWRRLALMGLVAAAAVAPWTIRNYLVLGRWVPVKSNLVYEMYQSQCLQPDGILQARTLRLHPYQRTSRERCEYEALGEAAYLDRKSTQFRLAVAADPLDLLDRIAARFLSATLWYVPIDRSPAEDVSWLARVHRLTHPLPFHSLFCLVLIGILDRLPPVMWTAIAIYCLYLTPYICMSYYARYAFPLLGVKTLLVVWVLDRLVRLGPPLPLPPAEMKTATASWREALSPGPWPGGCR
jgi:hypothetical protein